MRYISRYVACRKWRIKPIAKYFDFALKKHIVMLFGARQMYYGVVDTDTSSEKIVSREQLIGVEDIEGVTTGINGLPIVTPYQHKEHLNRNSIKQKMLNGIGVTTWNGMITNVRFVDRRSEEPAEIRLSQCGDRCADSILSHLQVGAECCRELVVVLDNKVSFRAMSFLDASYGYNGGYKPLLRLPFCVKFDITELSMFRTVMFYLSALLFYPLGTGVEFLDKFEKCRPLQICVILYISIMYTVVLGPFIILSRLIRNFWYGCIGSHKRV